MSATKRAVNLATLLTHTARRLPDHDAIVHGERRWTWRQLDTGVSALARELTARGVRAGDCVLLHSANHVELVQAMFATWRIGAILAPTNCGSPRRTHRDRQGLPTGADVLPRQPARPRRRRRRGDRHLARGHPVDLRQRHRCDRRVAPLDGACDRVPDADVEIGDPAWYFFTSGTRGSPKAAVLTHDQMGFVVTNQLADLMPGPTEQDASLVLAPLSHGAGVHLLPQIARGARYVMPTSPGLDPAEVWELVELEQISNLFTVPTILVIDRAPRRRVP